jgi:hypothetical protein
MQNRSDKDIEDISQESDRLLGFLNELQSQPVLPPKSEPELPPKPELEKAPRSDRWVWILGLMGVGLVGVGLAIGLALSGGNRLAPLGESRSSRQPDRSTEPLAFQASCGSPAPSPRQSWWPVLADADSALLAVVKSNYCGDAYINRENALQVASFTTAEQAHLFAQRLSAATGRSFRVGQPYAPADARSGWQQPPQPPEPSQSPSASAIPPNHGNAAVSLPNRQPLPGEEEADATQAITALYKALSNKDFAESSRYHSAATAPLFRPEFFQQFSRVSIDNIRVLDRSGPLVSLSGVVRFEYPDNSYQVETRTFTIDPTTAPPQVVQSSFGKIIKAR